MASDLETKSRYVVAVSGGVDSVVLLKLLHDHHSRDIVVAHVDHGIRPESGEDATFVRRLAADYGLPYEQTALELGAHASEERARDERYAFLREMSKKYHGHIVTAHHADDVVETVAINLWRGTGWRGLAVFGAGDIHRPLTGWFKHEVIDYAQRHKLEWREDSTNVSDAYLRNRIRKRAANLSLDTKLELLALWRHQQAVGRQIAHESRQQAGFRRYAYIMMPEAAACEVLAQTLGEVSLTRPQLQRALLAIKTARPGSRHHLAGRAQLVFGVDDFRLEFGQKRSSASANL